MVPAGGRTMKCPVCKTVTLHSLESAEPPLRSACAECGGQWVKAFQYWKWLRAHGDNLPELPPEDGQELPVSDSTSAKLCPECGHFLRRAKVGHEIDFHIDRCGGCGGLWFDKNEWEVLESRNLHDDVHFVFSSAWGRQVAEEEYKQTHLTRMEKILGPGDLAKVRQFKEWAKAHPKRSSIMSFLADTDV